MHKVYAYSPVVVLAINASLMAQSVTFSELARPVTVPETLSSRARMSLDGQNFGVTYIQPSGALGSTWHLRNDVFTPVNQPGSAISVANGPDAHLWLLSGVFIPPVSWRPTAAFRPEIPSGYGSYLDGAFGSSGRMIVGSGPANNGGSIDLLVWREGTGWLLFPGSEGDRRPSGVSANEQFIVGETVPADPNPGPLTPRRATRWNADGTSIIAPVVSQSARTSAISITDDGRLAVAYGFIGSSFSNRAFFLWDTVANQLTPFVPSQGTLISLVALTPQGRELTGMVSRNGIAEPVVFSGVGFSQTLFITDLLREQGFSLERWSNLQITTISNDGLKVFGSGRFEYAPGLFRDSAWIATIPTPSAGVMLGVVAMGLRRRR